MKKIQIVTLSILFCSLLSAQTPLRLSIEDCLKLADSHNLAIQIARAETGKAKILENSAVDLPQTGITLVQTTTDGGGPDNGLKFSQEFDFPTVYVARKKYLKAETEVGEKTFDMTVNNVRQEVYNLYYSWLHSVEICRLIQSQDTLYGRFLKISCARYEAGEGSRLEMLNANRLFNENRINLAEAESQREAFASRLRTLLHVDYQIEPAENELMPLQYIEIADSIDYTNSLTARFMESRLNLSQRNLALAKQGFMPTFTVEATAQLLLKGFNPYKIDRPRFSQGDFMGIEIGVSVPLFWGAQRARTRAASKDLEIEKERMEQAKANWATDYAVAHRQYQTYRESLKYFSDHGLKEAQEMVRLSVISYELGEIGYEEHARNLENSISVKRAYADAINRLNQTIITLKYLQGTL